MSRRSPTGTASGKWAEAAGKGDARHTCQRPDWGAAQALATWAHRAFFPSLYRRRRWVQWVQGVGRRGYTHHRVHTLHATRVPVHHQRVCLAGALVREEAPGEGEEGGVAGEHGEGLGRGEPLLELQVDVLQVRVRPLDEVLPLDPRVPQHERVVRACLGGLSSEALDLPSQVLEILVLRGGREGREADRGSLATLARAEGCRAVKNSLQMIAEALTCVIFCALCPPQVYPLLSDKRKRISVWTVEPLCAPTLSPPSPEIPRRLTQPRRRHACSRVLPAAVGILRFLPFSPRCCPTGEVSRRSRLPMCAHARPPPWPASACPFS